MDFITITLSMIFAFLIVLSLLTIKIYILEKELAENRIKLEDMEIGMHRLYTDLDIVRLEDTIIE